jgi:hypothetical protein
MLVVQLVRKFNLFWSRDKQQRTALTGFLAVRWSPENFLKKAVLVGHPFKEFSGLLPEVKLACEKLASWSYEDLVNWRRKKLGEWLRLAKSLQAEEAEIKK